MTKPGRQRRRVFCFSPDILFRFHLNSSCSDLCTEICCAWAVKLPIPGLHPKLSDSRNPQTLQNPFLDVTHAQHIIWLFFKQTMDAFIAHAAAHGLSPYFRHGGHLAGRVSPKGPWGARAEPVAATSRFGHSGPWKFPWTPLTPAAGKLQNQQRAGLLKPCYLEVIQIKILNWHI